MDRTLFKQHWSVEEHFFDDWSARSEVAARLIKPGASVIEFGCGPNQPLKRFLPDGCGYVPCDLVAWHDGVNIVDLDVGVNISGHFSTAVALGVIEYLVRPEVLFRFAKHQCSELIVSYLHTTNPIRRSSLRNEHPIWANTFLEADIIDLAERCGLVQVDKVIWQEVEGQSIQNIYHFRSET